MYFIVLRSGDERFLPITETQTGNAANRKSISYSSPLA